MLNSWGTNGNRPNGLFRMKMNMNYSCTVNTGSGSYYSRQFQNLETVASTQPFFDTNSLFFNGVTGSSSNAIWFRKQSTGQPCRYGAAWMV